MEFLTVTDPLQTGESNAAVVVVAALVEKVLGVLAAAVEAACKKRLVVAVVGVVNWAVDCFRDFQNSGTKIDERGVVVHRGCHFPHKNY